MLTSQLDDELIEAAEDGDAKNNDIWLDCFNACISFY
jgi:hypothetical protein